MRLMNKPLSMLLLWALLVFCAIPAAAAEDTVAMKDIGQYEEGYSCEEVTDSYGNDYKENIVYFKTKEEGNAVFYLKGEYASFEATMFLSNQSASDSEVNVAIFADGRQVYSKTDFSRRSKPEPIKLDLTGVYKLQIHTEKTEGSEEKLYFGNGIFTRAAEPAAYTSYETLADRVCIDSQNVQFYTFRSDSSGIYRCNYFAYNNNAYAYYNLNSEFETFVCTLFTGYTDPASTFRVEFYCDDVLVHTESGITTARKPVDVKLNVTDVDVLSMKTFATGGSGDDVRMYIGAEKLLVHQHSPGEWVVEQAPTCTSVGTRTCSCAACGEKVGEEEIPLADHTPGGSWTVVRPATCSEAGEEVQQCTACGAAVNTRSLDMIAHKPGEVWEITKKKTCTESGVRTNRCIMCSMIMEQEEIPATEHRFGSWEKVSGSLWKPPVVEERFCTTCGEAERRESDPLFWVKPLVMILLLVAVVGVGVLEIVLHRKGLPLGPSGIRALLQKNTPPHTKPTDGR